MPAPAGSTLELGLVEEFIGLGLECIPSSIKTNFEW